MSVFLHHEPCPQCRSRGADKKGNNLGRYSDGSAWCFACHYKEPRSGNSSVLHNEVKEVKNVTVSDDLCNDFPRHVVEWLARYDVSVVEAIRHGWKYSPKWDQLVFNFTDGEGEILFTQARNFREGAKTKYFNQGSPADVLPIFRRSSGNGIEGSSSEKLRGNAAISPRTLVVVEDAVSAARISRQCDAMPCLGSYLPAKKISRLRPFYEFLIAWLDEDKLKEAREIAQMAKWIGLSTKVVYTKLDPKEYSDEQIYAYLTT